jgi:hypothetical protein
VVVSAPVALTVVASSVRLPAVPLATVPLDPPVDTVIPVVASVPAVAILSEVVATSALNAAEGFTRGIPSLLVLVGYGLSFYFLSLTLRSVPLGIAYAIWAGEENRFLFYDSQGGRFAQTRLSDGPDPRVLDAAGRTRSIK